MVSVEVSKSSQHVLESLIDLEADERQDPLELDAFLLDTAQLLLVVLGLIDHLSHLFRVCLLAHVKLQVFG